MTQDGATQRRMRDVTARGVRTRVLEAGDEASPALVLVHGFLTSHREFEETFELFAKRFHVIAPDLPGFGDSEKPSPARYAYGIEAFAEALADLIAAFAVGRASLVGHAMGGAVAITLAAEHPELVQRLVLVDALCYPFPMDRLTRMLVAPVVGSVLFKQFYGRSLFRAHFREDVSSGVTPLNLERVDWHYDRFNVPSARESAHAVLRACIDTRPVVARLTRIATPTLIVWGRNDRIYPATSAQRLAREIAGAKLEIMDSGHSPQEERPHSFTELCTQFLEGRR